MAFDKQVLEHLTEGASVRDDSRQLTQLDLRPGLAHQRLLAAFAAVLYLGPDVERPRFRFITPGAVVAALLWIGGSALFALYTAGFASYNKTWGSLAGVIVTQPVMYGASTSTTNTAASAAVSTTAIVSAATR